MKPIVQGDHRARRTLPRNRRAKHRAGVRRRYVLGKGASCTKKLHGVQMGRGRQTGANATGHLMPPGAAGHHSAGGSPSSSASPRASDAGHGEGEACVWLSGLALAELSGCDHPRVQRSDGPGHTASCRVRQTLTDEAAHQLTTCRASASRLRIGSAANTARAFVMPGEKDFPGPRRSGRTPSARYPRCMF